MWTDGGVTGAAWVCDVLLLPQWGNGQLQVWVYCCWPKASLKIQKCRHPQRAQFRSGEHFQLLGGVDGHTGLIHWLDGPTGWEHRRVYTEARGGHQVSCSIAFHLIPLRRGPSLNLELGWLPTSPRALLPLSPTPVQGVKAHGCSLLGSKLRSSCCTADILLAVPSPQPSNII